MGTWGLRTAGFSVIALLLAGCVQAEETPPGVAGEPSTPGLRLFVDGYEDDPRGFPAAVRAYVDPGVLTVVTTGSGSCPDVAELVEVDPSTLTVVISISTWPRVECTADLVPRMFVLPVSQNLDGFSATVQRTSE